MPAISTVVDSIFQATQPNHQQLTRFITHLQGGWEVWLQVQASFLMQGNPRYADFTRERSYQAFVDSVYQNYRNIQRVAGNQLPPATPQPNAAHPVPNAIFDLSTTTGAPLAIELKVQNNLTENPVLKFRDDIQNLQGLDAALQSMQPRPQPYDLMAAVYIHQIVALHKTRITQFIQQNGWQIECYVPFHGGSGWQGQLPIPAPANEDYLAKMGRLLAIVQQIPNNSSVLATWTRLR